MFRKREIKSNNMRQKSNVGDEEKEENDEGPGLNRDMLETLKLERELKKSKAGVVISTSNAAVALKDKNVASNDNARNFETIMKSQYLATSDDGIQSEVQHEKILEDYIQKRLGVPSENER